MNTILEKGSPADRVWVLKVAAPRIAKKRKAGQFIILRSCEGGERIPLTIADADPVKGTITLVVQVVGKSTSALCSLEVGDEVIDLVGPLGKPTHIDKFGTVAMVCGGIGVAPSHPIAQAMKAAGNRVITIIGARSKDLVVWEDEMRRTSDDVVVITDDGSSGKQGLVTDALREVMNREKLNMVVAIGPPIMMKAVADLTRADAIPTVVSLNPVMVDGTGMCGGCRVLVNGKNQFVCVDGPEFDGHQVDFDNMMARLRAYKEYERESLDLWEREGHKLGEEGCRLAQRGTK